MLRPDGYVKVLDFGLAKLADSRSSDNSGSLPHDTDVGIVAGTIHYMSPEQALGNATDNRTDVFSFGVLLYELLSGRKPFDGPTASHVVVSILEHKPAPLAGPATAVPGLETLLARCLAKHPEYRYNMFDELIVDLNVCIRHVESGAKGHLLSRLPRIFRPSGMALAGVTLALITSWSFLAIAAAIPQKPEQSRPWRSCRWRTRRATRSRNSSPTA